ncbi:MAG: hypothetical protein COW01_02675 [Bdellovibrionales bacterium CG12_big_fil_rev_8_21_14_0_65_38_15]|nr:MAG: hypothetical protein COW79_08340 [Bdellovibrionales bacterium CG22_combo_CG10-13_8_21_14_all_38_13]PIQ56997.1 MAG: hypothetical protein COW01_02675 [Bdellovibrionales bacterium CG12_big_fil_rev_8_21_14_0_65_38_15]PIR29042.1 MAG: hypothetical protein COV38_12445 [Bdellovibrionales bacterium CG11_big_fil_rev_8_21_14_0_20_38_13]
MKQSALMNFNITWLPLTGLIIFTVCFCAYAFYTYKKSNKDYYNKAALIPLDDSLKNSESSL